MAKRDRLRAKRKKRRAQRKKGVTSMSEAFNTEAKVLKVDDDLGLVMGFAIISKIDGEEYFDLQGDHIPEDAMLKAATDFMENSRLADVMHDYKKAGTVVFAFPLTTEIAKAFDIETKMTGLMIAMRPEPDMLKRFKSGELTGFSIGGTRIDDEEVN